MWLFYLEDTYEDDTSHTNSWRVMTIKGKEESTLIHLSQSVYYKYLRHSRGSVALLYSCKHTHAKKTQWIYVSVKWPDKTIRDKEEVKSSTMQTENFLCWICSFLYQETYLIGDMLCLYPTIREDRTYRRGKKCNICHWWDSKWVCRNRMTTFLNLTRRPLSNYFSMINATNSI